MTVQVRLSGGSVLPSGEEVGVMIPLERFLPIEDSILESGVHIELIRSATARAVIS